MPLIRCDDQIFHGSIKQENIEDRASNRITKEENY